MKNFFLLFSLFFAANTFSQIITPQISARVDTTSGDARKVYQLYKDYLNSKPDSIYRNPFWNDAENNLNLKVGYFRVDRAAQEMYSNSSAEKYLSYYKPTILQIDRIETDRYLIKTLFAAENPEKQFAAHSVPAITRLYAVKDLQGNFKLENTILYDTRKWEVHNYKYIKYIVHPLCTFDKKEARQALTFCENIAKQFDLKIEPFTYYVLPNSDEFGKLYNFEYWLYYLGGQTNIPRREIFTSYENVSYPHEFVHILFPLPEKGQPYCPTIINEGLASWLGGTSYDESFEEALQIVSATFKLKDQITFEKIMNFTFRNEFDNNILYVTGGVICKMVYEKKGKAGVWKLYNSNDANFKDVLSELFGKSYHEVEREVIKYIRNAS